MEVSVEETRHSDESDEPAPAVDVHEPEAEQPGADREPPGRDDDDYVPV